MDTELLKKSVYETCQIMLNDSQLALLDKYTDLLLKWNEKVNLTAITDENEIIYKHFCDSLSVLKYVDINGKSLIDIGTGAGFPGVPLNIACDVNVTLLDSLNKRVTFLCSLINELGLKDIHAVHLRAEDGGSDPNYRHKYDFAVSRAVSKLNVLCEYCLPFVKKGGMFIAYKGPDIGGEIEEGNKAIAVLGGKYIKTENLNINGNGRSLVFIAKIKDTPPKYPRNAGLISKNPIM
ncbi:MAG: 16S rRNA (guanine(527)-N(7))-methyltransferase RsmG [Clostridiales bacterium]|jgi:16S rRNA (guanine527-N7)-methyltransferase|nr:16S rRNA (guanine(527)-N(7))-methyltransferase RsmG [Clostridiales bacterium]